MKNKKFLLTTVLPVALSVITGILIITVNNGFMLKLKAGTTVDIEKKEFSDNISVLTSKKDELKKQAARYDEILSQNEQITTEIEALGETLADYVSDIDSAKAIIAELDTTISDKQAYYNSLTGLEQETEVETISLSSGEYKCPSNIKAGRYTAEGTGKLYLYDISNNLKEEHIDLSVIDTHSYTFNISSGESIKVIGSVTLKKIETQN